MEQKKLPEGSTESMLNDLIVERKIKSPKITITAGSNKGDNYLGQLFKVTVEDEENEKERLDFIIKCSTRTGAFRQIAPVNDVYKREIYVYTKMLPAFLNFQLSKNIKNPFNNYPIFLKYSDVDMDELLIMQDMKAIGFVMKDRKVTLDFEHCKIVLQNLAKFHATSFALKEQNNGLYNKFADNCDDLFSKFVEIEAFKTHMEKSFESALQTLDPETDQDSISKFEAFAKSGFDQLMEFSNFDIYDEYVSIIHGDCWSNNILFKYEDGTNTSKPIDICFVDWQMTRQASPVIDLSYFIYNCTGTELRDEHFDDMIQIYYDSLTDFLKQLGSDSAVLYPFSVLQEHINKYFRYGLCIACNTIRMFTSEADEIPDINELDLSEESMKQWDFQSRNHELYAIRMSGIIKHAVSRKFI